MRPASRCAQDEEHAGDDTVAAMAPLTPDQLRRRERVEALIRVAAPALSLLLAAGERLSKLVEPEDQEYLPPRTQSTDSSTPLGRGEA